MLWYKYIERFLDTMDGILKELKRLNNNLERR